MSEAQPSSGSHAGSEETGRAFEDQAQVAQMLRLQAEKAAEAMAALLDSIS